MINIHTKIKTIQDVVEHQLCTGCGMCAYIEESRFDMCDTYRFGKRPFVIDGALAETGDALRICPGINLHRGNKNNYDDGIVHDLFDAWGPVFGVWEGYAKDDEIRSSASSGGAASSLALFCIENEVADGVIHTSSDEQKPYINRTVLSKSRADILKAAGSRYAPASPAEGLKYLRANDSKFVFIGKPCDVAAVKNGEKISQELIDRIPIRIAFFCAGVPSLEGNLEYLKKNGIESPDLLTELRYRGQGWPGLWKAESEGNSGPVTVTRTYAESWGYLQKFRQWRCYICPDHSGEFADISVGDPWYRDIEPGEPGKSLVIARSTRGLELIKSAEKAGYIILETKNNDLLPLSQPNLLITKGMIWARLKILKLFGVPVPKFKGFKLFKYWVSNLSVKEKLQSIYGTAKRIFTKKLHSRVRVEKYN